MNMNEALGILRHLARKQGWSRQKLKSLRGQILALENDDERAVFIGRLVRKGENG